MRLLVVGLLLSVTGCDEPTADPAPESYSGEPVCAAVVDLDGERYVGHGELRSTPEVTGRTERGTSPGCDDGDGVATPMTMEVEELADVPLDRGFLANGTVFIREGEPIPEAIRAWFERPGCDEAGAFELAGPWIGVRTHREVRFDGDLRAPYTVEMRIDEGPAAYTGTTLLVRATPDTGASLGPKDVKTSLWEGGDVQATVECVGRDFVATSLTSSPG